MTHNNHVIDGINKDLVGKSKQYYLDLAGDWEDPYGLPVIESYEGVKVTRDDLIVGAGSKVRGGDCLISKLPEDKDTIVYVQPRFGLAGVSILDVAKRHGKKVILFMPASKRISHHQACCIERGAGAIFARIAAMPNLNRIAKAWADERPNCYFVPLGLKHELVTAGFVKSMSRLPEPEEVWSAISTGVLTRSMQIAWPNAKFHAVAVSRNLKTGELGRADVISAPEAFTSPVKFAEVPPFPTINTYDGKVWRYIPKNTGRDILMWNVGTEPELINENIYDIVDSAREWGDTRDYWPFYCDSEASGISHVRLGEGVGRQSLVTA
jgi:hypothetical protein